MRHIKDNKFRHIDNEFSEDLAAKPKNQIFCPACKRPKLLFATEKKALNFMKFNADTIKNISGYCPVRAYYCHDCGGWHVTSQETPKYRTSFKSFFERYVPSTEFVTVNGGSIDLYWQNALMTA